MSNKVTVAFPVTFPLNKCVCGMAFVVIGVIEGSDEHEGMIWDQQDMHQNGFCPYCGAKLPPRKSTDNTV